ncbi:5'-nucleotidase, lipoprotein e(P4) family [Sphingomonas gellani]|uniref:5'-nucleotidase, lipoprotein e(P4) family n=1 Tax=Sphingomonas gellani TaxID=1166340 RepID=A0A1H7YIQ4_9SPHN|nr:5'-nucleotidase, lipoprotein e(P4) family [Sphingomonas gellani]
MPAGMQYLYGSGEAAAISIQAWNALTGYVEERVRQRPVSGVVLEEDATLAAPRFASCDRKPYAAVFDVDETVLLNRGFEYDAASGRPYEDARWRAYEITGGTTTVAVPGAKAGIDALRRLGVTVIFNSNRAAANVEATRVAIERAGLGPAVHGETLFLKGDDNTGSLKDARRWRIADRYCVIAMGGDQLGDFSDLFNAPATPAARRSAAEAPAVAGLWGRGWFVLPNPVYGTALKGTLDDIFPADARWAPEP